MNAQRLVAFVLAALSLAGVSLADTIPTPPMVYHGHIDKTALWRADISAAAGGTIRAVTIVDTNQGGGSSGVFSGFDLDFVLFDRDGNFSTTDDQIKPLDSQLSFVVPGTVRKGAQSLYQPTAAHPGPLFGVADGNGNIDHPTATLDTRDADFVFGVNNLSPDTSHGWVSPGDGGIIAVGFPLISIAPDANMFLVLGEVGPPREEGGGDELANAVTEIQLFVGAEIVPVVDEGPGQYDLGPGQWVNLDGNTPMGPPEQQWQWDLDGDGQYDDGTGPLLAVSFDDMFVTYGQPLGPNPIGLQTTGEHGEEEIYTFTINLVPDPATWLLLAPGLILVRRRRKAKARP